MAIFEPGSGYIKPIVLQDLNFTKGAEKQHVINRANNNRKSHRAKVGQSKAQAAASIGSWSTPMTPAFQSLDQLIRSLDAQYELLPNQLDWINFSLYLDPDWGLCANCVLPATGKKLYRQYNFNRNISTRLTVGTPVDAGEFCSLNGIEAYLFLNAPTADYDVIITSESIGGDWVVAQVGLALLNPIHKFPGASGFYSGPMTDATGQWYLAILAAMGIVIIPGNHDYTVNICPFATEGTPGLMQSMIIHVIN